MNYAAKWNKLDSIIFFLESKIGQIKDAVKDSKDDDPGVELMIRQRQSICNRRTKL